MITKFGKTNRSFLMRSAAASAIATLVLASPANAIVPNDNFTPTDIIDNAGGVNGVGMFFRNDGFVCSGTLINPRAVLFAAHCVNDRPESDYRTNGPVSSAFSFNVNALPGFQSWTRNNFQSNPDLFVYNISQIAYNPASVARPDGAGFLEADIALATLSDPAAKIPTWALLFSPLPTPASISDTNGTGYHVNITGYGRSGSGTTGASQGIDWRRRAAENMLGSLSSFDKRNEFLFGNAFGDLPQVLYRLDFDDPKKTNPFDFNLYKDEARTREATTAGGDSGGPLILDAANNSLSTENLQIGVLSGGSRFFGPQVFSSYGTESFYQPLFPFWDYIVATNPYRYVSAKTGDGAWEDATHWQTDLDPAYRIINSSGTVVNGIPTTQGRGILENTPQFGEVCFDPQGNNPGDGCFNFATGKETPPARPAPAPTSTPTSNIGEAQIPSAEPIVIASAVPSGPVVEASAEVQVTAVTASATTGAGRPELLANAAIRGDGMIVENVAIGSGLTMVENIAISGGVTMVDDVAIRGGAQPININVDANGGPDGAEEEPQNHSPNPLPAPVVNPAPTLANGLPGASGFVPNNINANVAGGVKARYFEVTLNKAGNTTLSSNVTIDRLNVGGAAGLVINSNGKLSTLIDTNQTGGRVAVNGSLTSVGDYSLFSGLLSGTGTVKAPFLTSIAGGIAPGSMGTIGTLTIDGNLILSSGSTLFVDVGASGNSDRVAVTGAANVGGKVTVANVAGFQTVTPSTYRILTANGGVTNQFSGASNLSAILLSNLTYSANAVDLTVRAQSYQNVIDRLNPLQVSYAALMDRNRGNSAVAGLFSFLDFTNASTIQATFDSWAPTTESTVQSMARGFLGNVSDFYQNRISLADRSTNGGTVAVIGRPVQLAAASLGGFGVSASPAVLSDAAMNAADSNVSSGSVNEDMAVYLAGGFINGDAGSMPLRNPPAGSGGDDEFDGFFISGGVEYYLDESSFIGLSGYYSDVDANVILNDSAKATTIMGSIYGRAQTFAGLVLDARLSIGTNNTKTLRTVGLGAQSFNLTTDDDSLVYASEVGLSKELDLLGAIIAPGIRGRAAKVNFSNVNEVGGGPALTIIRPDYNSVQGLAGVEFKSKPGKALQLRASMNYVHEFIDNPNGFGANFVGGAGALAPFALVNQDRNWGEVGVGLRYNTGNISFDLAADSTVGRSDVQSQVYSGAVTFRF